VRLNSFHIYEYSLDCLSEMRYSHGMNVYFKRFLLALEDFFFPSICEGCGKVGTYLCDKCIKEKIEIRRAQECHVCKRKIKNEKFKIKNIMVHRSCKSKTNLDGVFVIAKYSKFIENYIGDIKYEFYFAMIGDLVKVINQALGANTGFSELVADSVLTFVPLHPMRKRWRGFNQAERIAQGVAKYWGEECKKLLKRKNKTRSQVGLKRRERIGNMQGAFEFVSNTYELETRNVFVVDDVMTSGGTLEECAKVLKTSGCRRVYGLVFARG
jgi:competence protein ComFC